MRIFEAVSKLRLSRIVPSFLLSAPMPALRELSLKLHLNENWSSARAWQAIGALPLVSLKLSLIEGKLRWRHNGELDRVATSLSRSPAAATLHFLCLTSIATPRALSRIISLTDAGLAFISKFPNLRSVKLSAQGCTRGAWSALEMECEGRGVRLQAAEQPVSFAEVAVDPLWYEWDRDG